MRSLLYICMLTASAGTPPSATNHWTYVDCDDTVVTQMVTNWAANSCGMHVVDATNHEKRGPFANSKCEVYGNVWCGALKPPSPPPVPKVSIPSNCNPPFSGVSEQWLNPPAMVFRDENCSSRNAGEYWPLTYELAYSDLRNNQVGEESPWKHDGISSVYVAAGWRLEIYEHIDYQGKSWTICGPMKLADLRAFGNDSVSSMIISDGAELECDAGHVYEGTPYKKDRAATPLFGQ